MSLRAITIFLSSIVAVLIVLNPSGEKGALGTLSPDMKKVNVTCGLECPYSSCIHSILVICKMIINDLILIVTTSPLH